jgi:hypothetical protein
MQFTIRNLVTSPTTPDGWTVLYGPDATSTLVRQWIFYKFATGSETGSVSVTAAIAVTKLGRMYAFRNVKTTVPFVEGGGFGAGTVAAISAKTVITTNVERFAVSFVFVSDDNAVGSFTGETGGDWTETVAEFVTGLGNDGCIQLQGATMASASTISGGTYTMAAADQWGVRAFALKARAPVNGAASITDRDDTNNIYAMKKLYTGSSVHSDASDADGYTDINYVEFRLKTGGGTTRVAFRYTRGTNTFSITFGSASWVLDATSSASGSGNDLTVTWKFKSKWNAVEESGLNIEVYVIDSAGADATNTAQTSYVDVVTRLVTSSLTITNALDVGGALHVTGNLRYGNDPGSNTESSFYPPNAEINSVAAHDASDASKGTASISDGAFDISFTQPSGSTSYTYHIYVDYADASGTDADAVDGDTVTQYKVTITSSGIAGDSSGTVATLDAQAKTQTQLPYDRWCIAGYSLAYSFSSPVSTSDSNKRYAWSSTSGLSQSSQTNSFSVSAAGTITGTYTIQYQVIFTSSGILTDTSTNTVVTVAGAAKKQSDLPFGSWVASGGTISYTFAFPVSTTDSNKRYGLTSVSGLSQTLSSNTITVSAGGTVTGTYLSAWQIAVTSSGISTDTSGTVVTLSGNAKTQTQLPYAEWFNNSASVVFSFTSPVSATAGKQYVWSSTSGLSQTLQSNTFSASSGGTITGTYTIQYQVTITSSGISTDSSGTVATLGGNAKTQSQLPYTDWFTVGSLSYSFSSPVTATSTKRYVWASTSGMSQTLQSNTFTLSGTGTITGTYNIQYEVTITLTTNPVGCNVRADGGTWYPSPHSYSWTAGSSHSIEAQDPYTVAANQQQYVFSSWDQGIGAFNPKTITVPDSDTTYIATMTQQWYITITSFGIDGDSSGTVATLNGNAKTQALLPYSQWFNNGASCSYSFSSPVTATGTKRYVWSSTSGLSQTLQSNSFTVSTYGTITGTYVTQYYITVTSPYGSPTPTAWVDAGSSYATAVTSPDGSHECGGHRVDGGSLQAGTTYTFMNVQTPHSIEYVWSLIYVSITITSNPSGSGFVKVGGVACVTPFTFSWEVGTSHTLEALSPVSGVSGVHYVWISWSDLGAQSHSYTVPGSSQTVTANYKTQYYLTVNSAYGSPTGAGWYDSGSSASFSVTSPVNGPAGTRYVCTGYSGDASGPGTSSSITMDGPKTVTFNWKTQHQLTMAVSPSGGGSTSPAVGSYWYDAGSPVSIQATPAGGYTFSSWSGSGSGSYSGNSNPASITMNGPITETANFQSQVQFDFSVSINPTSGSVPQGGSVSATVTITLLSGATQPVSLSASGQPSGVTVSFSPASVTPTGTSTMTVQVGGSVTPNTYAVTITGTGGGKDQDSYLHPNCYGSFPAASTKICWRRSYAREQACCSSTLPSHSRAGWSRIHRIRNEKTMQGYSPRIEG